MIEVSKLKQAIKATGLKYGKISEMSGIPANSICQYLNGRPMPLSKFKCLCFALGFDQDSFVLTDSNYCQQEAM